MPITRSASSSSRIVRAPRSAQIAAAPDPETTRTVTKGPISFTVVTEAPVPDRSAAPNSTSRTLKRKTDRTVNGIAKNIAGNSDTRATNHVCSRNSRQAKGHLNNATNTSSDNAKKSPKLRTGASAAPPPELAISDLLRLGYQVVVRVDGAAEAACIPHRVGHTRPSRILPASCRAHRGPGIPRCARSGWVSTPVATSDVAHRRLAARNVTSLACARNGLAKGLREQHKYQPSRGSTGRSRTTARRRGELPDSAYIAIDYVLHPLYATSPQIVGLDQQGDIRAKTRIGERIGRAVRDLYISRSLPQPRPAASPRSETHKFSHNPCGWARLSQANSKPPLEKVRSIRNDPSLSCQATI